MILKKPYAFLIKYFRLINLLMALIAILITYKTTSIVTFFSSYVANDYSAIITSNFATNFINTTLYIALLFLLAMIFAIIYLFAYKKKPIKFYTFFILYYVILFIAIIISNNIFTSMEREVIAADISRVYRDVSILLYLPQFIFIIISLVRTLGFNLKQFNFENDKNGLNINENDNEEFELNIGFDTYKSKRKLHRFKREFFYYIKENLFIVICISIIITGIITYFIVTSSGASNTKYNQGDTFSYNGLIFNIQDSIITNVDSGGNIIKNNKYYLLLKIQISNNSTKDIAFDYEKIKIYLNNMHINPSMDLGDNFSDYAIPYSTKLINAKASNTYVFLYEIEASKINDNYIVKMHTGIKKQKNIYYATTLSININPLILKETKLINTIKINQPLNFSGTYLLNSNLIINNYSITNKYIYDYEICRQDNCNKYKDIVTTKDNSKTLLVLNGKLNIDNESLYAKSVTIPATFMKKFAKIEYTINGETKLAKFAVEETENYVDGFVLSVPKEINEATKINLIITIRNKKYNIEIKS